MELETRVLLRCMHPESVRKEIWERSDEGGRKGRRPDQLVSYLEKRSGKNR
jgi:hypothetical protein